MVDRRGRCRGQCACVAVCTIETAAALKIQPTKHPANARRCVDRDRLAGFTIRCVRSEAAQKLFLRSNKSRSPVRHLSWLLALLVSGCAVGPDYRQPATDLPDAWHQAIRAELGADHDQLATWWTAFKDDQLAELVTRTRANNRTLQLAAARVREARARSRVARGDFFPSVRANGTAVRQRLGEETNPVLPPGLDREDEFYQLGGDAVWELDLWGRVRRANESARASVEASIEAYRDTLVVLTAEVARNYIDVRTLQQRMTHARENIALQTETLKLVRARNDAGLVPDLDVSQAELNLARTESTLPPLGAALAEAIHRLDVLVGAPAGTLAAELENAQPIPVAPTTLVTGLPADLLRQRPDVRQAERSLAAQTARIGVATAELYPRFTLGGTLSLEAFDADNLLTSGAAGYGFGPAFRWRLFEGGRVRGAIQTEEARTEQALQQYEQTVLVALQDVESALAGYAHAVDRQQSLARAVTAATKSADLVKELYRTGLTDFQNVLDSEQSRAQQMDQLASNSGAICQQVVRLYRALGGGWIAADTAAPAMPDDAHRRR